MWTSGLRWAGGLANGHQVVRRHHSLRRTLRFERLFRWPSWLEGRWSH